MSTLWIAPTFTPPLNSKGERNKLPWVAPFWHVPGVAKGQNANMALKVLEKDIAGIVVKVPLLVNIRVVDESSESTWDKTSSKAFLGVRAAVNSSEIQKAWKRRKLA